MDFRIDTEQIKKNMQSIVTSAQKIATDPRLKAAGVQLLNTLLFDAGRVTGSIGTIGGNIAEGLTGGMAQWLENSGTDELVEHTVTMYQLMARNATLLAEVAEAAATLSDAFSSEAGVDLVENLIGLFVENNDRLCEEAGKLGTDIADALTQPLTDNAEALELALEGAFESLNIALGSTRDLMNEVGDKFAEVYDGKIKVFIQGVGEGLSNLINTISNLWTTKGKPALDGIIKAIADVTNGELGEFIKSILDLLGSLQPILYAIWQIILIVVDAVIKVAAIVWQVLQPALESIIKVIGSIVNIVSGAIEYLSGIIDIFVGLLSGDMETVQNGLYKMVDGVWHMIAAVANAVIGVFAGICDGIISLINVFIDKANDMLASLPDFLNPTGARVERMTKLTEVANLKVPLSLAEMGITKLANGGVTTGSTLANIGEAGREAVIPLERDTGWADIVADKLAERMGGGDYTFIAQLDGRTLFNETVKQNQIYKKANGRSAYGY